MPRKNRRPGRPQAHKRVRLEVVRIPEEQIDKRKLALALLALAEDLDIGNSKTAGPKGERP